MELEKAIENSWCAVTSLVVQDYLRGTIVWANAKLPNGKDVSHYFNLINDNEYDLTRKQFPEGTNIPKGIPKPKEFATARDYILSFEQTKKRYEILKEKVKKTYVKTVNKHNKQWSARMLSRLQKSLNTC